MFNFNAMMAYGALLCVLNVAVDWIVQVGWYYLVTVPFRAPLVAPYLSYSLALVVTVLVAQHLLSRHT